MSLGAPLIRRTALVALALVGVATGAGAEELALEDAFKKPDAPPKMYGLFQGGGFVPVDMRMDPGWGLSFRGGPALGKGWFAGLDIGMRSTEIEPTKALSSGTLFQFQVGFAVDWVLPLGPAPAGQPFADRTSLRLSLAADLVRGQVQPDHDDKKAMHERNLSMKQGLWGFAARPGIAIEIPIGVWRHQHYGLVFGAEYQWGVGEARSRLRDPNNPTRREKDRLRLDGGFVFVGLSARL